MKQSIPRIVNVQPKDSLTGFVNALSGLGGYNAKGSYGSWYFTPLTDYELSNMYRSNWLAKQIVDAPIGDMFREGWEWDGKDADAMQEYERESGLKTKLKKGFKRARLFGGAALVLHDGRDAENELPVGSDIQIALVSRRHITPEDLIRDPFDEDYETPARYRVQAESNADVQAIHRSRVIRLLGVESVDPLNELHSLWGDSVLDNVNQAVNNATRGSAAIANLLEEAAVDVFGIPNLTDLVSTQEGEQKLMRRVSLAKQTKSITHAMVLDAEEAQNYTQKQISFSNLPETQRLLLEEVVGASNVHMTRLLGVQSKGLSNNGDGDRKNYYDFIGDLQEDELAPVLMRIAEVKGYDARPKFTSLHQMTASEKAAHDKTNAETVKILSESGEVPSDVMFEIGRDKFGKDGQAAEVYAQMTSDDVDDKEDELDG